MNTLGSPSRSTNSSPRRLAGKLISLSVALAGIGACSENTPPLGQCKTTQINDVADSKDSETSYETNSETSPNKPSEISTATASISKRAQECYVAFRDGSNWCQNVMDYNSAGNSNFCDTSFADEPKKLQDICHKKAADCLGLWKQFTSCLDSLPVDASCKSTLRPLGMTHDTDGDGLSDHFELWHSLTNPCEPCSNGNNAPCDADGDTNGDGITNKDAQKFSGGCISYVGTEECG